MSTLILFLHIDSCTATRQIELGYRCDATVTVATGLEYQTSTIIKLYLKRIMIPNQH